MKSANRLPGRVSGKPVGSCGEQAINSIAMTGYIFFNLLVGCRK